MLGLEPTPPPSASPADRPLDFEKADFDETPPEVTCSSSSCCRTIRDHYYQLNGLVLCEACTYAARQERDGGSGVGRFLRALALGTLAGAAGAAVWYGIRVALHLEIGLIAIAVGLLVGFAVRKGSGARGGWRYQALAMAITYASICGQYVPDIVTGIREGARKTTSVGKPSPTTAGPAASASTAAAPGAAPDRAHAPEPDSFSLGQFALAWLFVFGIALAAPFLMGFQNVIGILIISFGVYEAWKINRNTAFAVTGPYAVGRRAAPEAPPVEPAVAAPDVIATTVPQTSIVPIKPA